LTQSRPSPPVSPSLALSPPLYHKEAKAMRYTVTISEFVGAPDAEEQARATWHYFDNLTLPQAWRIVERHARRGFNRYGGEIARQNWGARGGAFPHNYRAATIRLDTF